MSLLGMKLSHRVILRTFVSTVESGEWRVEIGFGAIPYSKAGLLLIEKGRQLRVLGGKGVSVRCAE
jgi:hypothetical protein